MAELLPARPEDGNKGTFGKVLLLAGSEAMAGAAILCGRSAFYAGSGMVKLSCPTLIHPVIQTALPEAMTADSVEASASWADVIGAGPGLSLSDRARKELFVCAAADLAAPCAGCGRNQSYRKGRSTFTGAD